METLSELCMSVSGLGTFQDPKFNFSEPNDFDMHNGIVLCKLKLETAFPLSPLFDLLGIWGYIGIPAQGQVELSPFSQIV